jgi:hypothetical protein
MALRSSPVRRLFVALLGAAAAVSSARVLEPSSLADVRLVEAKLASAPAYALGEVSTPPLPPRPPRKVALPHSRVTPAISRTARELLDRPMGSETILDVDGSAYAFAVERHYHSPESGITPTGWHKGVTVYALEQ